MFTLSYFNNEEETDLFKFEEDQQSTNEKNIKKKKNK